MRKGEDYIRSKLIFLEMKSKNALLIAIVTISAGVLSSCGSKSTTTTVSGNWITQSEFAGVARSEAVSFVVGDTAYITTGYDGSVRLNDLWGYDSVNNFWVQKADFPGVARSSAVAFAAAGKGYVGTGYDGANRLKDIWQYDPSSNSWTQKNDFGGTGRYDAVAFGIQNKGYILTGFDGTYLKDFWIYDPSADTWTLQGFPGNKRMQATSFVYNNKGYIVTGTNNGTALNDFWTYDPTTSAWTELRQISQNYNTTEAYDDSYTDIVRTNAVGFVIGSKGYLSTGESASGALLNSTWEYDFATDVWTLKQPFERSARTGGIAFSLGGGGYVGTGRSSTLNFDDLYKFFPDQVENAND